MNHLPDITKDQAPLLDSTYDHRGTSTMIFRFTPKKCNQTEEKLKKAELYHHRIENKVLFVIDHFFTEEERNDLWGFSQRATFSRDSYGSAEAIALGEKPAHTMNTKERWQLFSHPLKAIRSLADLFSTLAERLDADITTLPWELCDAKGQGSPSILANKVEQSSTMTMELGKHQDYDPEKKVSFTIPNLHSPDKLHLSPFVNGDKGRPWILTVMIYDANDNFETSYRLGTVFYDSKKELQKRVSCKPMRLVLFEGNIIHSIEESKLPEGVSTWRISYVFKIIINPKKESSCLKDEMLYFLQEELMLKPLSSEL